MKSCSQYILMNLLVSLLTHISHHSSSPSPADWTGDTVLTDDIIRIQIPLETPLGFVPTGLSSSNGDDDDFVPRGSTYLQLPGIRGQALADMLRFLCYSHSPSHSKLPCFIP